MFLYVIHMRFSRRRCLLAAAALVLVTGMSLLLAGCFGGAHQEETRLSTNEQRVAYLQESRRWTSSSRRNWRPNGANI